MSLETTENPILSGLNPKQLKAVKSLSGCSLVIAGAGSGKTAVLTRRIAYLIENQIKPGSILSLTFTNKAAKEMNLRLTKLLQDINRPLEAVPVWKNNYTTAPFLATFHSLGIRLLREFGHYLNLKSGFSVLDSEDQKKLIRRILKELNVDQKNLHPSLASYFIGLCKQELLTSSESRKVSKEFLPIFHTIYAKYEEINKKNQSVDFDDLILLSFKLLSEFKEVREAIVKRWDHILVDEFQDTNPAQFELIKLIIPPESINENRSLFVVGDDAQSIYGFRGSKVEIILNFNQTYSNCREIILNQNYRSTSSILNLAEKVLSHNPRQKKKELFTNNSENIAVKYYLAKNDQDEANYIIRQLEKQYCENLKDKTQNQELDEFSLEIDDHQTNYSHNHSSKDPVSSMFDLYLEQDEYAPSPSLTSYHHEIWELQKCDWSKIDKLNDCVVLYRTHAQSRSLEEIFLKQKLPYRLVSGVRFLDRKEIKDVLAILKIYINPNDKLSLGRMIPLLIDGVGPKTLDLIFRYLDEGSEILRPRILESFKNFQSAFHLDDNPWSLIDFTKKLISDSGYLRYLKQTYPNKEEFESRMENIGEIYSLMLAFDQGDQTNFRTRLEEFLNQISLMSQMDEENKDTSARINLMSLHQSKGLEFETVFLIGVEDGLLPHQNSLMDEKSLEEEVRLAYVGVTRAKKYLHLIAADSRIQFGQVKANPVSRIFRPFLDSHCQRNH